MQCLYQRGGGRKAAAARITEYDAAATEMAVVRLARESAVVIFSVSGCCMCHAVKRLFSGMGVSPTVHELDLLQHPVGRNVHVALISLLGGGGSVQFPVVFVGGRLVGSMDRVMAAHINGSLVPLLKEAGALWL